MMEYALESIGGVRCHIWSRGRGGAVLYWSAAPGAQEEGERVARQMAAQLGDAPWTLVAFEAESWNGDYSPWPAPDAIGQSEFSGGARVTLEWIEKSCIPQVEDGMPHSAAMRMIGGYSLAGLFSLYAFYESRLFGGAASCSGSLWYPGWKEYAQGRRAPMGSCVYLSLGRKEEKTRNRQMAAVGEMSRWQHERMQQDENVRACELVWHNGGHFTDVDRRIAQGFAWLIARENG